VIPNFGYL